MSTKKASKRAGVLFCLLFIYYFVSFLTFVVQISVFFFRKENTKLPHQQAQLANF
jgi:hypothetical protein